MSNNVRLLMKMNVRQNTSRNVQLLMKNNAIQLPTNNVLQLTKKNAQQHMKMSARLHTGSHPAKIDLNKNWLPMQKSIQNFNIDAQGFRKTRNENPPTR